MSFFFSSRRRHTRYWRDWSSDVCSSDLGRRVARGVSRGLKRRGEHVRRFKLRAEHLALAFGDVVRLRAVAQVVDGHAAAEVYVFERVARLLVNRLQVLPHHPEGRGEGLYVGRLRSDVYVYA